jgi:hypothetical protein
VNYAKQLSISYQPQPNECESKNQESVSYRLFGQEAYERDKILMGIIDRLNEKHGKQTLRFGWGSKSYTNWEMRRQLMSPCQTTRIVDILTVKM